MTDCKTCFGLGITREEDDGEDIFCVDCDGEGSWEEDDEAAEGEDVPHV